MPVCLNMSAYVYTNIFIYMYMHMYTWANDAALHHGRVEDLEIT